MPDALFRFNHREHREKIFVFPVFSVVIFLLNESAWIFVTLSQNAAISR